MKMLIVLLVIIIGGVGYLYTPQFGRLPQGEELKRIEASPHYKNGKFQNLEPTKLMTGEKGSFSAMLDYLLGKHLNTRPQFSIPAVKTDLQALPKDEDILVWFGHSSYFAQINGIKFLVDPVFSKRASPVPFSVVAFDGTNIYTPEDMPDIDYLIITHDHWDHLDYPTVTKLRAKVGKVITGLGVGAHLRRWGFSEEQIVEMDWQDKFTAENVEIFCLPARHFSGRGLVSDKSLWASYLLKIKDYKFYVGGDSGYGRHYQQIGQEFADIDVAVLEDGQYDKNWKEIHEAPEMVLQAARDLNAHKILPVHNSKFTISNHPWYEPLEKLAPHIDKEPYQIMTPMIGEKVNLRSNNQKFKLWWRDNLNIESQEKI